MKEVYLIFKNKSTKQCDEIKVQAAARRKKMAISVESRAAVTEPEKYIRDIRRIKR